jgi:hypothetical protein
MHPHAAQKLAIVAVTNFNPLQPTPADYAEAQKDKQ